MVNIPFSANVTGAVAGIKQLQAALQGLGLTAQQTNNIIGKLSVNKVLYPPGTSPNNPNTSLTKQVQDMRALDNATLRVTDRLARFLTAISGVKNAFNLLFGEGSNIAKGFEAIGEGTRVFANLAQLAKDNLGLVAAGAVGISAAGLLFLTSVLEARIKATTASTEASIKAEQQITEFDAAVKVANKSGEIFNDTFGEKASRALQLNRSELENALKQLRLLEVEREKLKAAATEQANRENIGDKPVAQGQTSFFGHTLGFQVGGPAPSGPSDTLKALNEQVQAADRAIDAFQKRAEDIERKATFLKLAEQLGKYSTAIRDLGIKLQDAQRSAGAKLEIAKLLQPNAGFGEHLVEDAKVHAAAEEVRLRAQILENTYKERSANEELIHQLTSLEGIRALMPEEQEKLVELQRKHTDAVNETRVAEGDLLLAQRRLNDAEAPRKFTERFTIPFTEAIGNAFVNGILEGKKAIEIVADLSKNLLGAALNDVVKNFTEGMKEAFKSIAGAGGELLGSALITVVGVVAGVLGKRASSTDSFNRVKDLVESTEAVRGIVAGPQNVAIAAVGSNLKRALIGVESRLDVLIRVAVETRDKVGGVSFAGSVPTP